MLSPDLIFGECYTEAIFKAAGVESTDLLLEKKEGDKK